MQNTSFLAAAFGNYTKFGQQNLDEEGKLHRDELGNITSNPWARQVQEDINKLQFIDGGDELLEEVNGKIITFFQEHAEWFTSFDITALRAFFGVARSHPKGYAPECPLRNQRKKLKSGFARSQLVDCHSQQKEAFSPTFG